MAINPSFINSEEWLTQTIADDEKVLAGLAADKHPLIKASLEHQRNYWIKRREAVRFVNKASSSSSSSYPRRPITRNLSAARDMLSSTLPTLSPHASHVLAYIQSVLDKYEANDPEVSGILEWRDWWKVEKRFLLLTGVVPAYFTSCDF